MASTALSCLELQQQRLAGHLAQPAGALLAMKGVFPEEELAHVPVGYQVVDIYPLHVPRLSAERHLAHLTPVPAV